MLNARIVKASQRSAYPASSVWVAIKGVQASIKDTAIMVRLWIGTLPSVTARASSDNAGRNAQAECQSVDSEFAEQRIPQ